MFPVTRVAEEKEFWPFGIKVKGQWRYFYRAVHKQGQTVDFLLSKNRDQAAG